MARYERFTFLCNRHERNLILDLAKRLRRSQADAVRYLIITAAEKLNTLELEKDPTKDWNEESEIIDKQI